MVGKAYDNCSVYTAIVTGCPRCSDSCMEKILCNSDYSKFGDKVELSIEEETLILL